MTVDERVDREHRTIEAMMAIHCRGRHGTRGPPCADCAELLAYAEARTARCRRLPARPACRTCPTHCWRRGEKERIREVMRYAGPRMPLRHPLLALRHALDERRQEPGPGVPARERGTPFPSPARRATLPG